jgi:hypothetical protein
MAPSLNEADDATIAGWLKDSAEAEALEVAGADAKALDAIAAYVDEEFNWDDPPSPTSPLSPGEDAHPLPAQEEMRDIMELLAGGDDDEEEMMRNIERDDDDEVMRTVEQRAAAGAGDDDNMDEDEQMRMLVDEDEDRMAGGDENMEPERYAPLRTKNVVYREALIEL